MTGLATYPAELYPGCPCYACDSQTWPQEYAPYGFRLAVRMSLCPHCGNKRCPGARDHNNECSGSNDPGQPDSLYADAPTWPDDQEPRP